MLPVTFELTRRFDVPVRVLWDELVDWSSHGDWIPATTIEGDGDGAPGAVGSTFTAWTGFRPIALEDRMRIIRSEWDDDAQRGECAIEKLGPVLGGTAGFSVRADGSGSVIEWHEDVTVPRLPAFLAPLAAVVGRLGFALALRRLAKVLARR